VFADGRKREVSFLPSANSIKRASASREISESHFWQKFPGGNPQDPPPPHGRTPMSLHTLLEWCACLAVAAYFMDRTCYSETN